jgi:hypothetical protein
VQQQAPPPHLMANAFGSSPIESFSLFKKNILGPPPPPPPNMLPRLPPPPQVSNSQQPPPLMSLNPFNENSRDAGQWISSRGEIRSILSCALGLRLPPPPTMFENAPPALMSMPVPHYDNNQHDDYVDTSMVEQEQKFDWNLLATDVPYFDLPAGLMCPLLKV